MIHTKGQGAMEYLMTYGWAILVVIIVGVVLWQMGIFSGGSTSATFTGFGPLKPVEWSCNGDSGMLTLTVLNGAGGQISGVNMTVTGDPTNAFVVCGTVNDTVAAGATIVCATTAPAGSSCLAAAKGTSYSQEVSVAYKSPTGQMRTSSGSVKGPAD